MIVIDTILTYYTPHIKYIHLKFAFHQPFFIIYDTWINEGDGATWIMDVNTTNVEGMCQKEVGNKNSHWTIALFTPVMATP